ncbi:MAG: hypothetical protein DLM65_08650 [Candidatus Aeolococcus gillhamiae]|uniref:Uncharacterized protein n=1 Tax=Candidatus Aeolococcus gillhamiae TaxID=3127015 RepID=A0A2W5Z4R3_9BACT|nr:MAG: hypothetical protein DLM65_08650 [Candidatus Dormibacter sp. RRmetagenome_bin12]
MARRDRPGSAQQVGDVLVERPRLGGYRAVAGCGGCGPCAVSRRGCLPAGPGSEYDVAFDAEGTPILTGDHGPRYLGRLPVDDPQVLEWSAEQRPAELAAEQEAQARRDTENDAIEAACGPLRVLYREARRARQRTALLAVFIEEITR